MSGRRTRQSGRRRQAAARRTQRVAAYAVIVRDERVLLSRLADRLTATELWTLPGGGVEHGEDPRDAVVREVFEETGLHAQVGAGVDVHSVHQPSAWRDGRRVNAHALRLVYEGWVPTDSPDPSVQEVDGSTAEAAWIPIVDVLNGTVPVVALVQDVLGDRAPVRHQRLAVNALALRGGDPEEVLLVRVSARGFHTGLWTLPGGGVDHGEPPRAAMLRELREETGLEGTVGRVVTVHDEHFSGTAPSGRFEDFHAVQLVFAVQVDPGLEPRVVEEGGTTDEAAWVPIAEIESGIREVHEVVRVALAAR